MLGRPNFHSLEVVDRVSETQLQVGENSDVNFLVPFFCVYKYTCVSGYAAHIPGVLQLVQIAAGGAHLRQHHSEVSQVQPPPL